MFGFKKKVRHMNAGNTTFYQFDRDTGFWGIPDISHEVVYDVAPNTPVRATHNSDGNRDTEFAFRPGEKNVIFLGGSHTWGLAVEQDARYTDLLKQEENCNALNMAHPSLGLDQNALALFRKTPKFKPDIVVIEQYPWALHRVLSTSVNGFLRPHFSLTPTGECQIRDVPYLGRFGIYRKFLGSYHEYKKEFREFKFGIDVSAGYDQAYDPMYLLWKTSFYDYMYNLAEKVVLQIQKYCEAQDIRLLFVLGVDNQKYGNAAPTELLDYDLPRARFASILEKNGIDFVDTTTAMLARNDKANPVAYSDGHINNTGHEIFADQIIKFFRQKGWLAT